MTTWRTTRTLLALLMAGALALVACGDDDADDASGATSASATEAAEPEPETTGEAPTTGPAPDDEPEPDDVGGETVSITDVIGDKEVPVVDENVYALDELMGALLLTLDVEPTTAATFFEDPLLEPILDPVTDLVEVGSIESVAATRPELIVGIGHPNLIELHDEYQGIAPTVLPDFTADWREQTRLIADVVGREEQGEAVIAAVEQRTAVLAAEVGEAGLAGQEVAIIQALAGDFFAYGPTTISGAILEELGFVRSAAQSTADNFGFIPVAPELIPDETNVPYVFSIRSTVGTGTNGTDTDLIGGAESVVSEVGEGWFQNTALGAWIVLSDLEAILFDRGEVTFVDGADEAFAELLEAARGGTDGGS